MEAIVFLLPPLAMCLVIASIHVYLGRGPELQRDAVVTVASGLGNLSLIVPEDAFWQTYAFALAFTFVGATIFAFTRRARKHVSQEAIVGIVFAVASAVTVLLLSRSPHGAAPACSCPPR